jgi:hypothetical protein
MLGNPYSSNEPGLGPLMRDVKNKICQDCELVALLEDDNGMELLVNNKIISLDLPVREVSKGYFCWRIIAGLTTKILCTFLIYPMCAMFSTNVIIFEFCSLFLIF